MEYYKLLSETVNTKKLISCYKEQSMFDKILRLHTKKGTCGLSVTTFFHQVLNYYYLTVYIMFKPKMSLEGSVH